MLAAYRAGKSTISALAAVAGATVEAIDVGVGRPTGDIRFESAMSPERFDEAIDAGRSAVESLDADLRTALSDGGLTPDDLKEILLQQAVYCGVPAAHHAFAELSAVIAEAARRA